MQRYGQIFIHCLLCYYNVLLADRLLAFSQLCRQLSGTVLFIAGCGQQENQALATAPLI